MPEHKEMVAALDAAFADQMRTLYLVLATDILDPESKQRFVRGLENAHHAYRVAFTAIGDTTP